METFVGTTYESSVRYCKFKRNKTATHKQNCALPFNFMRWMRGINNLLRLNPAYKITLSARKIYEEQLFLDSQGKSKNVYSFFIFTY